MSFRILADDGSIHQFPDGTRSDVMQAALARYHASLVRPAYRGQPRSDRMAPGAGPAEARRTAAPDRKAP